MQRGGYSAGRLRSDLADRARRSSARHERFGVRGPGRAFCRRLVAVNGVHDSLCCRTATRDAVAEWFRSNRWTRFCRAEKTARHRKRRQVAAVQRTRPTLDGAGGLSRLCRVSPERIRPVWEDRPDV
jgi:hypothetical protein